MQQPDLWERLFGQEDLMSRLRTSDLLEYECGVRAAKSKTVRHDCLETGAIQTLGDQWCSLNCRIRIIDIDRWRNEVILEHEQAMNCFLHPSRAQ